MLRIWQNAFPGLNIKNVKSSSLVTIFHNNNKKTKECKDSLNYSEHNLYMYGFGSTGGTFA